MAEPDTLAKRSCYWESPFPLPQIKPAFGEVTFGLPGLRREIALKAGRIYSGRHYIDEPTFHQNHTLDRLALDLPDNPRIG